MLLKVAIIVNLLTKIKTMAVQIIFILNASEAWYEVLHMQSKQNNMSVQHMLPK